MMQQQKEVYIRPQVKSGKAPMVQTTLPYRSLAEAELGSLCKSSEEYELDNRLECFFELVDECTVASAFLVHHPPAFEVRDGLLVEGADLGALTDVVEEIAKSYYVGQADIAEDQFRSSPVRSPPPRNRSPGRDRVRNHRRVCRKGLLRHAIQRRGATAPP